MPTLPLHGKPLCYGVGGDCFRPKTRRGRRRRCRLRTAARDGVPATPRVDESPAQCANANEVVRDIAVGGAAGV